MAGLASIWQYDPLRVTAWHASSWMPTQPYAWFIRATWYTILLVVLIGRVPKCPRTLLLRAWYIINAKLLLFSFIAVTASVGEERRFQDPVPAAPASVNISSSPRTSYLDQRRSPASVTVQMEEKNQPPSASSLYESRFRGRTVTWFVLFSGERKREAGTKFESRRIFSRPSRLQASVWAFQWKTVLFLQSRASVIGSTNPWLIVFLILITFLRDNVMILYGEGLFWSLVEVRGLNSRSVTLGFPITIQDSRNTLTSGGIFSILFFVHFPWYWQGGIAKY